MKRPRSASGVCVASSFLLTAIAGVAFAATLVLSPFDMSNLTGSPSPRYAVIDLGTNMVPMKITSGGGTAAGGGPNPVFVLMYNGTAYPYFYYRWSNGQAGAALAPANTGDGFQSTDIDENGRVVGIEGIYPLPEGFDFNTGTDLQLAVWAPGATTAVLTTAPSIGREGQSPNDYYMTGYWGNDSWIYISQYVYIPINNGEGGAFPLVSPGSIWSSQMVYYDWGKYTYNELVLYDGFQDQTELGAFRGVVQTPGGSTGDLGGTQVTVLAVNDSNQALLETSTNFQTCTDGNSSDGNTWHPSTTTYTVAGHTVPFMPLLSGLGFTYQGQGILSNVSSLGKSYVLGSDIAVSWSATGFGPPTYSTPGNYYCWDGTNTMTLPQPTNSLIAPQAVNAATTTLTTGLTTTTVAATQVIGNYGVSGYIWNMVPSTNSPPTFAPPQRLDALIPQNSGWSGISAASINDSGCIAGTATYTQQGTNDTIPAGPHGVVLLPCQFSLLNGSTNSADVDGMDFNGNRPTTMSDTASYAATTVITNTISAEGGIDMLGVAPLGQGRANDPGNAYAAPIMMLAKVSPPNATNITYGWNRVYQEQGVGITFTNGYWYVHNAISEPRGVPPPPQPDRGSSAFYTVLPSTNNNVLVYTDAPAMSFSPGYVLFAPNINDYAYEKTDFTYSLTNSIGSANAVATQHVGQIILAKRIATSGTVTTDWIGKYNIISTTNIPNCNYFTTNEIQNIVGTNYPIVFDSSVKVGPNP